MVAERLDAVARPPLPDGFSIRRYQPGDRETWTRIHAETGAYDPLPPDLFEQQFGTDEVALGSRQLFAIDPSGRAVGTATAWMGDPAHGFPGGRLHWVAVIPAFQRRGIASALVGAVCTRFEELGEHAAYLTTGAENERAIALYTKLGFRRIV